MAEADQEGEILGLQKAREELGGGAALFGNEVFLAEADVDEHADRERQVCLAREGPDVLLLAVLVHGNVFLLQVRAVGAVFVAGGEEEVDEVDVDADKFVGVADRRGRLGLLGEEKGGGEKSYGTGDNPGALHPFYNDTIPDAAHAGTVSKRGRRMKKALKHLSSADERMAALIQQHGAYGMTYRDPSFWALARSIAGQQLSVKAASTIFGRFEAACGPAGVTPERVLAIRETTMRKAGLSAQKSAYLKDLARKVRNREIVFEELPGMDDTAVIERLTQVKGVGVWTVHMFLMFALRRPDVLPVGDLGIRVAMQRPYGLPEAPKPAEMERIAAAWQPWRTAACWYLWRSLDGQAAM